MANINHPHIIKILEGKFITKIKKINIKIHKLIKILP
jgi:hypothetical protein